MAGAAAQPPAAMRHAAETKRAAVRQHMQGQPCMPQRRPAARLHKKVMFLGLVKWMPNALSWAMNCRVLSGPGVYVM
jgi:hypothetical protein